MDMNCGNLKKNAFRVTKQRGITASRVRIPGGHMNAAILGQIQHIAETYGSGEVHVTLRQGFEILGIPFEKIKEVNKALQPIIEELHINQGIADTGYSSSGTRNVMACIGNRVCPFANYDTTALAQRIEKAIFPNDLHFKIALTGCPNDCGKVRMHDFGIIGMTEPQFDPNRCISCGACVKKCEQLSVKALRMEKFRPIRNTDRCIGCGVCVHACPNRAWTRSKIRYFRLTLLGRSGKKNPRMGIDFIKWVDADSIVKIITNTYAYAAQYIDPQAPGGKEHIGYIVDRTGTAEFLKWAMKDVHLPDKAEVYSPLYWNGIRYSGLK
ncbi:sulfite reductase subunit C [Megasphaera paucivorans]|uniref:Anaerobic sulfite reductase subunit C n=1 Tax=Megasphaera paucivorans TaxID=349095 RepID=A0A1G9ZIC9_9FIRM|nr:sulfite reductase subunit C [Megasphaera paucivorans]SDN20827.1 anaerobic sulfite reductase subunit C [Megasphaera paucivorans]